MEKSVSINVPEGFEIDKCEIAGDNSRAEITFRPIKKDILPKTWEELRTVSGYYADNDGMVEHGYETIGDIADIDASLLFPTREEAEASIALAQLCQLRDRYNGAWTPSNDDKGYGIFIRRHGVCFGVRTLALATPKLRDEFDKNFADLIEKAKPLLG